MESLSVILLKYYMQKVSTIVEKLDDEEVIELVEHLQPVRSVIQNTDLFKVYDHKKIYFSFAITKEKKNCQLLWKCFENLEARSLKFYNLAGRNGRVLDYGMEEKICHEVLQTEKPLLKCETICIKMITALVGLDDQKTLFPVQDIAKIFTYLPNLKFIDWRVAPEKKLNNKVFTEIFPKYCHLKKLETWICCDDDVDNFCEYVEKSSKKLESLSLQLFEDEPNMCRILNSLNFLHSLKRLDLEYMGYLPQVTNEQIESLQNLTSEITVKELHLMNPRLDQIQLMFHFMTNLTSLVLILNRYDQSEWTPENLKNLQLEQRKKIQHLRISRFLDKPLPISLPTIFQVFPNLKTLIINRFEDETEDIPEMNSMIKLIVENGAIKQPRLLKKMPNLTHVEMEWSSVKEERTGQIKTLLPYLPSYCKLFENGKEVVLS